MKYRRLGQTDMTVSILGFGASSLGSVFRATDDEESARVVHSVINAGVNYIDTAPWYGHGKSEAVLGKGLADIPRDKYFITTKVGRYLPDARDMFDFSAERTLRSVDESLARLGLEHVDIIQVHDMEFAPNLDVIINETLPALQKVRDSGKARYIGITGYPLENFRTVIDRSPVKIDTVLTYCRYSINDSALTDYIPYFKERGVGVVSASPISMGLLSNRGPPSWHPATQQIKDACRQAADYCQNEEVDISRLAMQYSLSNDQIDTTLVSSASVDNMAKNISSVETDVSDKEANVLQTVMKKYMEPLRNAHWEGLEVEEYWRQIKADAAGK